MMDCCALILVGVRELPPLQARMTFGMARQVVVEMARSFRVEPSRYDGGDRLPAEAYARMVTRCGQAGVDWDGGAEGEMTLLALRATYEPLLDGLARHLLLPMSGWLPDEDATDHSERGHRGLLARRLIEQLVERSAPTNVEAGHNGTIWRRLRRRLE